MKRTILCLLLAVLMLLCACGGESTDEDFVPLDDPNVTAADTLPISDVLPEWDEDTAPTVPETAAPAEPALSRTLRKAGMFYEDRAWIEYTEGEDSYYGIIDLQGNVLCRFKYDSSMIFWPFSNGFTHTYNHETKISMIIDRDGNVTYQLDESSQDKPRVVFRGAGIQVSVENASDFYGTGYQYTILDHEGNMSEQFTVERELNNITDCGKGVIRFHGKGYLCLQTHTWVSDDITREGSWDTPNFVDAPGSACVIGVENSEVPQIVFLSADGSTRKVPVNLSYYEDLHSAEFHLLSDDFLCITRGDDDLVATMNIATGEMYTLDKSYSKILEYIEYISDDRIIVSLRGADNGQYHFIFDQYLNLICGPLDYFEVEAFSESIIIGGDSSNNTVVFDKDHNILFSLSELDYIAYNPSRLEAIPLEYSCGALLACDKGSNPVYLDREGNLLFETLNFENTKHNETIG